VTMVIEPKATILSLFLKPFFPISFPLCGES
jgi:hypothetical protein